MSIVITVVSKPCHLERQRDLYTGTLLSYRYSKFWVVLKI